MRYSRRWGWIDCGHGTLGNLILEADGLSIGAERGDGTAAIGTTLERGGRALRVAVEWIARAYSQALRYARYHHARATSLFFLR